MNFYQLVSLLYVRLLSQWRSTNLCFGNYGHTKSRDTRRCRRALFFNAIWRRSPSHKIIFYQSETLIQHYEKLHYSAQFLDLWLRLTKRLHRATFLRFPPNRLGIVGASYIGIQRRWTSYQINLFVLLFTNYSMNIRINLLCIFYKS